LNVACGVWGLRWLTPERVTGKHVLEVGSRDVNGSFRPRAEALRPATYIGIDLESGPGVDVVCDLLAWDGTGYDLVICTEMLEHTYDWRSAVNAMKRKLKVGGWIVLTTRSPGFPQHDYPADHWRFTPQLMREVFSDLDSLNIAMDTSEPGVFVAGMKIHDQLRDLTTLHALPV